MSGKVPKQYNPTVNNDLETPKRKLKGAALKRH
jgi:hypothetical protein